MYVCVCTYIYMHVQLLSRVQLCDFMHYSPPGSSHGISQARILGWVAISCARGSSRPKDRTHLSYIGRRILHHWATREAHMCVCVYIYVCSVYIYIYIYVHVYIYVQLIHFADNWNTVNQPNSNKNNFKLINMCNSPAPSKKKRNRFYGGKRKWPEGWRGTGAEGLCPWREMSDPRERLCSFVHLPCLLHPILKCFHQGIDWR